MRKLFENSNLYNKKKNLNLISYIFSYRCTNFVRETEEEWNTVRLEKSISELLYGIMAVFKMFKNMPENQAFVFVGNTVKILQ